MIIKTFLLIDKLFNDKYDNILMMQLHYLRDNFNTRLKQVRADKQALYSKVLQLIKTLKTIHAEIPKTNIKTLPNLPITDNDIEFPEENLQVCRKL